MFRFSSGKFCLLISSLFISAAALSASCVTGSSQGCVHFEWKTSGNTDQYTNATTTTQQSWFQVHMSRIMGYSGYWSARLPWFPNSWFYQDASNLYSWDPTPSQHPEWILHNQHGTQLFVNWGCSNGTCPQYAPDYSNEYFRQWWIAQARSQMAAGYKGIFIDDVNMVLNLSNGSSQDTPIDYNTGQPMTQQAWEKYLADFLVEVRQAFPKAEICHNAIWYAGNASPGTDPYLARQIKAANYFNLERGFADGGLTGDGGFWSIQNVFSFIDTVHSYGVNVLPEQYGFDGQFSLAAYLLINNGSDLFANDAITPGNWPSVYDVNLGQALGSRYNWNGLIRRDFANGMVLLNPPNNQTVSVPLPASYVDSNGNVVGSVSLNGREGAVLTDYMPVGGPVPDGTYAITNNASHLALDDPALSTVSGTQMIQWSLNGGRNQMWHFASRGGGYYTIQNQVSNLYLAAPGSNGSALLQQASSGSAAQLWSLRASGSSYVIVNKASGLAIDDPAGNTQTGTGIIVWSPNGGANQSWAIH